MKYPIDYENLWGSTIWKCLKLKPPREYNKINNKEEFIISWRVYVQTLKMKKIK